MPLIIQAAEDKSWRVRLCLSKNFTEIATNFGKEVTDMSLIQTFSNLLKELQSGSQVRSIKTVKSTKDAWDSLFTYLAAALFLSIEWFRRRRIGLS